MMCSELQHNAYGLDVIKPLKPLIAALQKARKTEAAKLAKHEKISFTKALKKVRIVLLYPRNPAKRFIVDVLLKALEKEKKRINKLD